MSSSLRRGALAAAAIAFSIASLASCAAGNNAETHQINPDNARATVGDIMVQNAVVVTQPDLESTGPAIVAATIFNNGTKDQTLDSVVVDGVDKKAELTAAQGNGKLTIPVEAAASSSAARTTPRRSCPAAAPPSSTATRRPSPSRSAARVT